MTPDEIDCAQFYDAFSPLVVMSLEEVRVRETGRERAFAVDGELKMDGGRLQSNTAGGCLSEAYVRGMHLVARGCGRSAARA
jgi:thiolase-like protein